MKREEGCGAGDVELAEAKRLIDDGELEAALSLLLRLRRQRPGDPAVLTMMGDCYAAAGQWHHAASSYEQALALSSAPEVARKLETARMKAIRGAQEKPKRQKGNVAALVVALVVLAAVALVAVKRHAAKEDASAEALAEEDSKNKEASRHLSDWWFKQLHPERKQAVQGGSGPRKHVRAPQIAEGSEMAEAESPWDCESASPPDVFAAAGSANTGQPGHRPAGPRLKPEALVDIPAQLSDRDVELTDAVSSLAWPDGTSLRGRCVAFFDPYPGCAVATVAMPGKVADRAWMRSAVTMAGRVAGALFEADPDVQYVMLRMVCAVQQPPGRVNSIVAFRANVSRGAYEQGKSRGAMEPQKLWDTVFTGCWLNPALSKPNEQGQAKG